jgi:hypothetical protein
MLLTSVGYKMCSQIPFCRKMFTTYTTNKRPLATMSRCGSSHLWVYTESLITNATNKWFRSQCVDVWVFKLPWVLKPVPQTSHLWGFSPVWVKLWVLRYPELLKPFSHSSQLHGFSPVLISKCSFKFELSVNPLPQYVQEKGSSPVWVSKCLHRSTCCMYPLQHAVHMCGFSCVCERACFLSLLLVTNLFPQSWHR